MKGDEVAFDGYPVVSYWYKDRPWKTPRRGLLRLALFKQYPNCYWCGIKMKIYPHIDGEQRKNDMATIDHLKSTVERGKGVRVAKVLACEGCNQARSIFQNPNNRKFHKGKLKRLPVDK